MATSHGEMPDDNMSARLDRLLDNIAQNADEHPLASPADLAVGQQETHFDFSNLFPADGVEGTSRLPLQPPGESPPASAPVTPPISRATKPLSAGNSPFGGLAARAGGRKPSPANKVRRTQSGDGLKAASAPAPKPAPAPVQEDELVSVRSQVSPVEDPGLRSIFDKVVNRGSDSFVGKLPDARIRNQPLLFPRRPKKAPRLPASPDKGPVHDDSRERAPTPSPNGFRPGKSAARRSPALSRPEERAVDGPETLGAILPGITPPRERYGAFEPGPADGPSSGQGRFDQPPFGQLAGGLNFQGSPPAGGQAGEAAAPSPPSRFLAATAGGALGGLAADNLDGEAQRGGWPGMGAGVGASNPSPDTHNLPSRDDLRRSLEEDQARLRQMAPPGGGSPAESRPRFGLSPQERRQAQAMDPGYWQPAADPQAVPGSLLSRRQLVTQVEYFIARCQELKDRGVKVSGPDEDEHRKLPEDDREGLVSILDRWTQAFDLANKRELAAAWVRSKKESYIYNATLAEITSARWGDPLKMKGTAQSLRKVLDDHDAAFYRWYAQESIRFNSDPAAEISKAIREFYMMHLMEKVGTLTFDWQMNSQARSAEARAPPTPSASQGPRWGSQGWAGDPRPRGPGYGSGSGYPPPAPPSYGQRSPPTPLPPAGYARGPYLPPPPPSMPVDPRRSGPPGRGPWTPAGPRSGPGERVLLGEGIPGVDPLQPGETTPGRGSAGAWAAAPSYLQGQPAPGVPAYRRQAPGQPSQALNGNRPDLQSARPRRTMRKVDGVADMPSLPQ